jgi:hypothetical protein
MIGTEMEALLRAIDVRVQIELSDEGLGSAARKAENDEIELSRHRPNCASRGGS